MKNIVICCDGTNNQIKESPTNVFRLFQGLEQSDSQVTFYAPGVGTMAQQGLDTPLRRRLSLAFGLAFGAGLQEDYEQAYRFLMEQYESGDRVFVFGFSRGALTARALAGMVHMFGLLEPGQENLVPYLSRSYAQADFGSRHRIRRFTRTDVEIAFLGLWDTVSSYGFAFRRRTLPYTANNPIVKVVRHAISLDERRAYFRSNRWGRAHIEQQCVKEVWFPGVHSDVGGGYAENDLARIALHWMVEELQDCCPLAFRPDRDRILFGAQAYEPNPCGRQHESLQGAWWALEFLPKNATLRRGKLSLPLARRRAVRPDAEGRILVHQSVLDRQTQMSEYEPANLPKDGITAVPWGGALPKCDKDPAPSKKANHAFHIVASLVALVLLLFFASTTVVDAWTALRASQAFDVLVLFVVPAGVLFAGGWLLNLLSGLPRYAEGVGTMLHARASGYDERELRRQVRRLGPDGLRAYRSMLWIDVLFPAVYGYALWWTFLQLPDADIAESMWWFVLACALPGLTALADECENFTLLGQMRRPPFKPNPKRVRFASRATRIKISAYTASAALPPLFWIGSVVVRPWWDSRAAQYISAGVGVLILVLLVQRVLKGRK